ncbi:MAG: transposase [Gammaproteobacteria bacterium]|nr:transposase [Gammaproteobacteria bacterium]
MITLAELARDHRQTLVQKYGHLMRPEHHFALRALMGCRTSAMGEVTYRCDPCHQMQTWCHSCGHRFCPKCQHQSNSQWLLRQQQKLLPVNYFMATFTLPYELRQWVWQHQRVVYTILFKATVDTLNTFAGNDKQLLGKLGMTAVLHTHNRRLDFHPHVHVIIPAGSFHKKTASWHSKGGDYLFNEFALAIVFRAKFLALVKKKGLLCPQSLPKKWVAQCQSVGRGEPALKYLARYLYRGVISESNIISHENGDVSFRYQESKTKSWKIRTEPAVKFLWLVLQHVLPKGFRRARDFDFLHCLAKRTLQRIQLLLKVAIGPAVEILKKPHLCPSCHKPMSVLLFSRLPEREPWRTS